MSNGILRTIVLYGEVVDNKQEWSNWYNKSKNLIELLGYKASHFAARGGQMQSGNLMTIKRSEAKLLDAIEYANNFKWLSVYSLLPDYKSAIFDYSVFLNRSNKHVVLTAVKSDLERINANELIDSLKEHIQIKNGEIYDMEQKECPFIYAEKLNPITSFKTLKIIKTIQG